MQEIGILEDDCPVCCSPARKTWDPAVNMRRGGYLDIPDCQSERREDFPDGQPISTGLYTLTRPHTADLLILKTSQDVAEERRWPDRIIIRKHYYIRLGIPDSMSHLQPLIGEWNGKDTDLIGSDRIG